MSAPPAILRQCLDRAVAASAPLMQRVLDQAIASLQDAENKSTRSAERRELADGWRELQKRRHDWTDRFPQELRLAFEAGPVQPAAEAVPQRGKREALTLVDDAALVETIESARLSQLLLAVVEQPLAELDALMSTALGLSAVRPEQNPVRPDIFAAALRTVMTDAAAQPAWLALWVQHLCGALGRELETLYRDLTKFLAQANVHAATYRVLPVTQTLAPGARAAGLDPAQKQPPGTGNGGSGGGSGSGAGPASNDASMRSASAWADLSSHDLGDGLLQDFLFHGGSHTQTPLAPSYYARVDEELNALQEAPEDPTEAFDPQRGRQYQHLPAVDRPLRRVATDSPLSSEVWGVYGAPRQRSLVRSQLKKKARRVGQVMGLEVVRKLVNQVAQDPRLLAPVRESIVALEPTLLRLAMVDPRFFGDEQHPARRLIERVAERSFKYNDEFSAEFKGFAESVTATFNGLNQRDIEDVAPFESALAGMEASWATQDEQEEQRRGEVLDAVRFAEKRQAEADQIGWDLSQRADLESVPSVVQDFLFGPWALVMAHARLTDTRRQIDPGAHGSVVTDLLWSVKRDITLRQPSKLIEMIPGLLDNLRTGLAALGQDPKESEAFFQTLEKLHRPVLKLRARKRRDTMDSSAMELETDTAALDELEPTARQQPKPGDQLWMGRRELDAAGFEDTLPTDHAELTEQGETASTTEAQTAAAPGTLAAQAELATVDVAGVFAGLREDCWVDLYSKRRWLRAKLIWASTKSTLFMFVSHGGQPHSMTRRSCERLIRDRLLRLVDTHGVVSQAIDTLAKESPVKQPLAA